MKVIKDWNNSNKIVDPFNFQKIYNFVSVSYIKKKKVICLTIFPITLTIYVKVIEKIALIFQEKYFHSNFFRGVLWMAKRFSFYFPLYRFAFLHLNKFNVKSVERNFLRDWFSLCKSTKMYWDNISVGVILFNVDFTLPHNLIHKSNQLNILNMTFLTILVIMY